MGVLWNDGNHTVIAEFRRVLDCCVRMHAAGMSQSNYQRVCKQMVQMYGPQWTEKWGTKNDAWENGLKDFSYSQIGVGLGKVMRSGLKYYEIDLPTFLEMCKPPAARPMSQGELERPKWAQGLCTEELLMHQKATMKMIVWCSRHKRYGLNGKESFSKEQNNKLYAACHQLAHDFFLMRQELGAENVPDDDFFKALYQRWSRIADAG